MPFRRFARLFGRPGPRGSSEPAATKQFRRVLEHERARSDRSGESFCVLALALATEASERELAAALEALRARLRRNDSLGWLGRDRLGLLLRDVELDQACRLAEELSIALGPVASDSVPSILHPHPPPIARARPNERLKGVPYDAQPWSGGDDLLEGVDAAGKRACEYDR